MVLGAEDRLTPVRSTSSLQKALPNADICVLEGAGHTIMVEAPNAMLDALHRIL
jgi:pimeloyl-ACP methyl ester carboxylesterase